MTDHAYCPLCEDAGARSHRDHSPNMTGLTKKDQRRIERALQGFFQLRSFLIQKSHKELFRMDMFDRVSRELRLTDNRVVYLSDRGRTHMETIIQVIDDRDLFDGLADSREITDACRCILAEALSDGKQPETADELLEVVRERVTAKIATHTFAVPLFGVALDGVESLTLGTTRIVPSLLPLVETAGIEHEHARGGNGIETTKAKLWMIATAEGTPRRAEERFRERAELVVGMLAAIAATVYRRGASAFRIGVAMSGEALDGRAVWFSWDDKTKSVTTHYDWGYRQEFKIDKSKAETLGTPFYSGAFNIIESHDRTDLEEAIAKAVYWFSDAHRDPVAVMKLIKYWSAVETFFSSDIAKITHSVSVGLAGVLVYGGYKFVPEEEYLSFKQRVADLYNLRSRALHGASYDHVTERDVDNLSKWVGQMLINMVSFVHRGYTTLAEIKEKTLQLYETRTRETGAASRSD